MEPIRLFVLALDVLVVVVLFYAYWLSTVEGWTSRKGR